MNTLSKAISILSISLIISMGGVKTIAQARCYTTNYNKAEQLYRQGRYAEARRHYAAASACPDKPKQNNIATRISACDNAIREAADQHRRQQEAEQARKREREAARNGYIRITNVEFGNIDDDGNIISDYGSTLYASDILYLQPRISYEGLCSSSRNETFDVKIYRPDGSLKTGSSSPSGYSYSTTETIYSGNNRTTFSGWGNKKGGSYTPGTYRFEVWHDGNFVYSTNFTLFRKSGEASRLTVDNKTSVSTSFRGKGGQETFYISTDADSWTTWGVPSWCSISSKTNSSFTLICEPNTSSSSRSDYMKVKAGGKEVRIDITQGKAERSAEIESIWVDHNYWNYGIMGMRIHVKFSTYGMLNRSGRCVAYFYYDDASDTPLRDFNNLYSDTGGNVCAGEKFKPKYESSVYNDFTIFIPYGELHMAGSANLKFRIRIYDEASDEWLCDNSAWQSFTYYL